MTGAIALRVYLACMFLLAGLIANHVQRQVEGTPMRFVMSIAAFAWGCGVVFVMTGMLVAVIAGSCFIFLGYVPDFIARMAP